MSEPRQRRSDQATANAVARGLNILSVRDAFVARRYMEHKQVPEPVIERTLTQPGQRRKLTPEQCVTEAILPLNRRNAS
ncbi:hypothetical protein [Massilia sp. DD77]|uniref:hypothetical protein n=1 Tax=Massilia sp. DD77 TaxID=3109349 RepID=UPI002FFEC28A